MHCKWSQNQYFFLILLQQENIKNALSQITRKILSFQKKSDFPEVKRTAKFFMSRKIRLIICLLSHKKFGLKAICFV
jgi:hypothetical protein